MKDVPSIKITTDKLGKFDDVCHRWSRLIALLSQSDVDSSRPVMLFGSDARDEIDSIIKSKDISYPRVHFPSQVDFQARLNNQYVYHDIYSRLDKRLYEHAQHKVRDQLSNILKGRVPLSEIIPFILYRSSASSGMDESETGQNFIRETEALLQHSAVIMPWAMKDSLLPVFTLALWSRHVRIRPLIFYNEKNVPLPNSNPLVIQASRLEFDELTAEIERVFDIKLEDIEKGYRVWQLSRADEENKPSATTPRFITLETARSFLTVLTRARTPFEQNKIARQKPAPLMFELKSGEVDLKSSAIRSDADVISGLARSLLRRVEHLNNNSSIVNVVPSSVIIFPVIIELLEIIRDGLYREAHVVELGCELCALQWHVEFVKSNISDVSLGELAGVFAASQLLLTRFAEWRDYDSATSAYINAEDDGVAFSVARSLLQEAQQKPFLTFAASQRIEGFLSRTSEATTEPALKEGVVRSGENLAAVTANGLSSVLVREAKAAGDQLRDDAYQIASKSIIEFAIKNAPSLLKLAEIRNWPWLSWLNDIIKQLN